MTDVPRIATLRYFWVEDKDAAQALAHNLGGPEVTWTVRDFTSFRPKPSPGTIEVLASAALIRAASSSGAAAGQDPLNQL